MDYCTSLFSYQRRASRAVAVGCETIGGEAPILLQSMTTADTLNKEATVAESIRMIEAGCALVRITAPSKKDAAALEDIAAALRKAGHNTPIAADIHFTPNAAELAAEFVEKIRVNPGNYADKKKFETHEYTDATYAAEIERIRARFIPLVEKCKRLGRALRIGTNHGSLSDRILSRYGDTPEGMVESALEFLRICRALDFHDVVISMKSSNTLVMVQAYRLLVSRMNAEKMDYPLHLGVTEAGEGEDGRIKSAVGIGTLLEDGLGDTIRVSLTEPPEEEIPVARQLAVRYIHRTGHSTIPPVTPPAYYSPFAYHRRPTDSILNMGGHQAPVVINDLRPQVQAFHDLPIKPSALYGCGYRYNAQDDKWQILDQACDWIYTGASPVPFALPGTLGVLVDAVSASRDALPPRHALLYDAPTFMALRATDGTGGPDAPAANSATVPTFIRASLHNLTPSFLTALKEQRLSVLVLETTNDHAMAEMRAAAWTLDEAACHIPIILHHSYTHEDFALHAATDIGGCMIDGIGDGIWVEAKAGLQTRNQLAFGILQATRTRISKTEYISCPSCGRTLFDLQETTGKIRAVTDHLKGLKIGIMGCIVNGPGEMADADYGYVGTGPGKITLYKEQLVVRRNIPEQEAVEALVELIREHGDWVEPSVAS